MNFKNCTFNGGTQKFIIPTTYIDCPSCETNRIYAPNTKCECGYQLKATDIMVEFVDKSMLKDCFEALKNFGLQEE